MVAAIVPCPLILQREGQVRDFKDSENPSLKLAGDTHTSMPQPEPLSDHLHLRSKTQSRAWRHTCVTTPTQEPRQAEASCGSTDRLCFGGGNVCVPLRDPGILSQILSRD